MALRRPLFPERSAQPYEPNLPYLSLLNQSGNPNQDHRSHECHQDRTDYSASWPDVQKAEHPASHEAPKDSQDDVYEYAVAATLHNLARQPSRDQTNMIHVRKLIRVASLIEIHTDRLNHRSRYSFVFPHTTRKPVDNTRSLPFKPTGG